MKLSIGMLSIFFLLLYSAKGITQDAPHIIHDEIILATPPLEGDLPPTFERSGPAPGTFHFISSEFEAGDKVVKGAPYSAEAITESVQTLGDGNRIVQKSNSKIFRDSEGRIRREHELGAIGTWAAADEVMRSIFINDPVAKVHYILEPEEQMAHKMKTVKMKDPLTKPLVAPGKPMQDVDVFVEAAPAPAPAFGMKKVFKYFGNEADSKKELLGTQMMEGVKVEGTRTTTTIPAQQIGNERPIEIVSEKWYSPELQVQIMTHHSDPRFGETTYRLVNVNRTEPDPALFQVPAGYKVTEDQLPKPVIFDKKLKQKRP
jgi:hypothetical protein